MSLAATRTVKSTAQAPTVLYTSPTATAIYPVFAFLLSFGAYIGSIFIAPVQSSTYNSPTSETVGYFILAALVPLFLSMVAYAKASETKLATLYMTALGIFVAQTWFGHESLIQVTTKPASLSFPSTTGTVEMITALLWGPAHFAVSASLLLPSAIAGVNIKALRVPLLLTQAFLHIGCMAVLELDTTHKGWMPHYSTDYNYHVSTMLIATVFYNELTDGTSIGDYIAKAF